MHFLLPYLPSIAMGTQQLKFEIPINQNKASKRVFGGFITLIVGIGLIAISASGGDVRMDGAIFGGLLVLGGIFQFVAANKVSNAATGEFAFRFLEDSFIVNHNLTESEDVEIAYSKLISAEIKVSAGGTVSLILNYKNEEAKSTFLNIDVQLANIDYLALRDALNKINKINKESEERAIALDDLFSKIKSY